MIAVQPQCFLSATLPHPPGINATYRVGQRRFYKSNAARDWEQAALLTLRAAGFRTLPPGVYWVGVAVDLYTIALDLDGPLKLLLDTLEAALGVPDSRVGALMMHKTRVHHRADQRLDVRVVVVPLEDPDQFNACTARAPAS